MQQARKWEDILQFVAVALAVVLANILAASYFFRLDLTEERRYTLAEASKATLASLAEPVYVEVYLAGDLNASFQRLQKTVRETLDEFGVYSGQKVTYKLIDPATAKTEAERAAFYRELATKGINPTNLYDNVDGKRTQKIIFPGAVISYGNRETAVQLLKGNKAASPQEQLNQSVEGVEYELITAIKKLTTREKPRVALVGGHDELDGPPIGDLVSALDEFYVTERVDLRGQTLDGVAAALILQPKKPFSEAEKFKLDQFIMGGGKALFFIDKVQMNLDSIGLGGAYAFGYDLNLDDLLFRYGVRANLDLIQDWQQMGQIVLNVGNFGSAPNIRPVPWPYYVLANRFADHPTTRNLNAIYTRFLGTIDTVKAEGVRKTPVLFTNQYTRVRRAPTLVSLDELKADLNPKLYTKSYLPVAYLLEGSLPSLFKNRFVPEGLPAQPIQPQSVPTKVLVCADGDVVRNDLDRRSGQPLPLGFDPLSRQQFSNKEWVLNTLAYMLDEGGLINTRLKEVKLRPLDKVRLQEEAAFWRGLNLLLPLVLVLGFGAFRFWRRKRKYARAGEGQLGA
jgi:gliding-associated putative ABC transporter substrate-binding component GldG